MPHKSPLIHALDIISSMLKSDEMDRAWGKHNASRKHENAALKVADRIDIIIKLSEDFENIAPNHTELLSFARSFVELELKASKGNAELYAQLDQLAGTLAEYLPDDNRINQHKLPKEYKDVLRTLGQHTVMRFAPWQDLKKAAGHLKHHFQEIANDFPVSSKVVGGLAVPAIALLMAEGMSAKNAPTQLEVQETCSTNLSATNVFGDAAFDPEIDMATCNPDFKSCHDNLRTTFPNAISYIEGKGINVPDIPHCTLVNNLAYNTQEKLLQADDILKDPYYAVMDVMVDRPLDSTRDFKVFENSHFIDGAEKIAKPLQDLIYYVNRVENALHPILGISMLVYGFMGVFRARRMSNHEWAEFKDSVIDFTTKAGQTRALNYVVPALAVATYLATHGYDKTGSYMDSNIVALTAFGAIAGYLSHRLGAKFGGLRKNHVSAMCDDIAGELENFTTTAQPLSEQKQIIKHERRWKTRQKWAMGGSLGAMYGGIVYADLTGYIDKMPNGPMRDMVVSLAEGAGMLPVATGIIGGFLPYNFLIEDPAQHAVFIGGGTAIGTVAGVATLTAYLTAKYGAKFAKQFQKELIGLSAATSFSLAPANADTPEAVLNYRQDESKYEQSYPAGP